MMNPVLPSKLYDTIKYLVLIAIPAFSVAYVGFDSAFDGALPYENQVAKGLAVLALLLGTLTGISSKNYNQSDQRFDGSLTINENDSSIVHQLEIDIDPDDLGEKKSMALRVKKHPAELPPPE